MRLRPSDDVCCLFYKHATSRLYDRATYLCSVKLTFKMASYELRNGRIAARHDAHVRVRKAGKYPVSRDEFYVRAPRISVTLMSYNFTVRVQFTW